MWPSAYTHFDEGSTSCNSSILMVGEKQKQKRKGKKGKRHQKQKETLMGNN
jgi:hypothetical protein